MGAPRPQIITEARASGAPVITRSLKFDNLPPLSGWVQNPYQHLYKRMPRYGNDRCFTYSCWFKRDQIYGQESIDGGAGGQSKQYLIASEGDTSVSFVRFNNDNGADTLRILGPNSDLITEANFRDTIGWYHVVVAVDTTQATAANRVKLYVNGVQFSDWWSSGNTFPPQNQDYTFSDEVNHLYIGYSTTDGPSHNTFRGNMSEVYMLQGTQLPPTEFGFEDPLTGTWRPKKFNFDQQYQAVFNAPFSSIPSTDSSGNSITITDPSSGGVSVASAGSNNFGITNALDFGGGNDDLIVCGSSAFDGTGTIDMSSIGYTIDFYLKADGDLASGHSPLTLYFDPGVASGDRACRFYMDGGNLAVSWENTGSAVIKTSLDTNWHHVRLSGSGIWFDGTYAQDPDFTRLIGLNTAVRVLYGGYNSVTANTYKWKGMLGPLRIMNGDLGAPPPGGLVTNSGNLSNIASGGPSGMSLYLPFDGSRPIGENQRKDPSFTHDLDPINFGGTKTTEEATGGFPIYNTINGGRTFVPGIRGQAGIAVTVYNSKYYLDGEEAPSLSKHRGQTITFDTSDSTVSGHPFRFATAADAAGSTEYTKGSKTGAAEASVGAATTITFPHDAPNTLYYYCSNHNGMGGSIGLSTDHKIADPCAWKCMFATPLISDQNDVSASIAATISSNLAVSNSNVTWPQTESNFGSSAAYFVKANSTILTPTYHADAFGFDSMGDFTIEGWFWQKEEVSGGGHIFSTAQGSTYQCSVSTIAHGGYPGYCLNVEFNGNSAVRFRSKEVIPMYQWHHFAFCRSGGTGYLYVDGTMQESKSLTVSATSNTVYMGRAAHDAGAYRWTGYLQDFRIYNGVAKYTSNFEPATTYPAIIPDSPSGVVHSSALAKYTNGSVSFDDVTTDANGDYLSVPENSAFDLAGNDFTLEAWVYQTTDANNVIANTWYQISSVEGWLWTVNSDNKVYFYFYNDSASVVGPMIAPTVLAHNRWYHVATTRVGNTFSTYIDGKLDVTSTSSDDVRAGDGPCSFGRRNGLISNLRIINGTAIYTQDFTPSSKPLTTTSQGATASEVKLLCCQNKNDATAYAASPGAITVHNDAAATTFNPFDGSIDLVRANGGSGYCQMNSLDGVLGSANWRFYDGNLRVGKNGDDEWYATVGTVNLPPRGKWQYEMSPKPIAAGQYPYNVKVGWLPESKARVEDAMGSAGVLVYDLVSGGACKYQLDTGSQTSYGTQINTPGVVVTMGIDFDNRVAKFAVDGVLRPDLNISGSSLYTSGNLLPCMIGYYGDTENYWDFNFGQRPFQFSFGEDYKTICTANTESPGLARADRVFKPVGYTGDSNALSITDVGFKPDLIMIKNSSDGDNWDCTDSVRGANNRLIPNGGNAASSPGAQWTVASIDPTGFTVGAGPCEVNTASENFVAYCWKAGGSKGTFNKDDQAYATAAAAGLAGGSTSPTGASVGTKEGFSILRWTATGNNLTISHGLTKAPELVILKNTSVTSDWWTYHVGLNKGVDPEDYYVKINEAGAETNAADAWQDTKPTASLLTIGSNYNIANSGNTIMAYCWHSIPGVQKFGYYIGNGNADGPYIDLGFKPALLIYKKQSGGENWQTYDNVRNLWNPTMKRVRIDLPNAQDSGNGMDMLSDGFKLRSGDSADNTNDAGYIYMAWAYNPFHNLYGAQAPAF